MRASHTIMLATCGLTYMKPGDQLSVDLLVHRSATVAFKDSRPLLLGITEATLTTCHPIASVPHMVLQGLYHAFVLGFGSRVRSDLCLASASHL